MDCFKMTAKSADRFQKNLMRGLMLYSAAS
jgi:hypothetical protein